MNATYDEVEQRWKGIQPSDYYRYESFFREVSYNKLAEKMIEAGYVLERSRSFGFNIRGFPPECREMFSKRREEIERVAAAEKTRNQDRLQSIAVRTRAGKKHIDADMLRANWRKESRMHLPSMEKVITMTGGDRTFRLRLPIWAKKEVLKYKLLSSS